MELHSVNCTVSMKLVSLILILCGILSLTKLDGCLGHLDHRHHVHVGCMDVERNALLQLKHGITEDPSGRLSSWAGQDCCKWRGVSCDNTTRHVIKLNLRNPCPYDYDGGTFEDGTFEDHRLYGEINSSLVVLKHLNYLDLSHNYFTVQRGQNLSFIGSLWNLRYLNLSNAIYFEGVNFPFNSIGNLSRLRYLDISYTSAGTISSLQWLPYLTSLKYLDLGAWDLSKVSPYLFQTVNDALPTLQELHLSHCQLEDLHPLVNLTSLMVLDLSFNNFNSTLPYWLFNLKSLVHLNLESNYLCNNFHGPLPDLRNINIGGQPSKNMGNLSNLQTLVLANNGFSGEITNFLESLSGCSNSRIESLDLSDNKLVGSLPNSLGFIKSLRYLYLDQNTFQGSIPNSIGNLTSLEVLGLAHNTFQGSIPNSIGNLTSLEVLNLVDNTFEGSIPNSIGNLTSLEVLGLADNTFEGSIPNSIGNLTSLEELNLAGNTFQGSIPNSIGNLTSLEELDLSYNNLSGIPKSIGQLSMLTSLFISGNFWQDVVTEAHLVNLSSLNELEIDQHFSDVSLVFNISSDWLPPFKLTLLYLDSCRLGPKFPTWLKNQNELTYVRLINATISDNVPNWFWQLDLQLRRLDFSSNSMSGKVPNPRFKFEPNSKVKLASNHFVGPFPLLSSKITWLNLSNNQFSGPIPSNIGEVMPNLQQLDISHNSLNGSIPLSISNLDQLQIFVISNNHLTGQLPNIWGNMSALSILDISHNSLNGSIPLSICNLAQLQIFLISNNHLTGQLPNIWGNMYDLSILDMSNNFLSGTIPRSMGSLRRLNLFILSNNNLFGEFPPFMKNCTKDLLSFDIGDNNFFGKLPYWIGENMSSLSILNMRSNFFTGNISSEFCGLSNLQVLDLSNNGLTGHIPHCISNFSGMKSSNTTVGENLARAITEITFKIFGKGRELDYKYGIKFAVNSLDLSNNKLSGEIPVKLTSLIKLNILNLSMNYLIGKIPADIGDMKLLESLDLSMNKLVGQIPVSMASLTFLSSLNLSYNNLSGRIPTGTQLQTLEDRSIYQGNVGLCGKPLHTNCSDDNGQNSTQGSDKEDKDSYEFENLGFFISMALGFIVGFWGVFGTLSIKKSWRKAYFGFVDRVTMRASCSFH